jgi:hypothetical protein
MKKKKNNDGKCTESKQKKWWQWYVEKKKTLAKQNHKAQLKDNQMLKDKIKFLVFLKITKKFLSQSKLVWQARDPDREVGPSS